MKRIVLTMPVVSVLIMTANDGFGALLLDPDRSVQVEVLLIF